MNAETIYRFPLFTGLPKREIETLVETLREVELPPGEILFEEGSTDEQFYILLDGEVEIVKALGSSDERLVAVSGKDSIIGEMGMFSRDGSHTASARARTPLKLLRMTFAQLDALLQRNPSMAFDLLRLFSRRLEHSENLTITDLREKNRQLTLAYQELKEAQAALIEKEMLERELQIASEIQRSILPEYLPNQAAFDFGALMIPARLVGGDFYDFIPLDKQRVGIVVGDVCDKGVPAALFMALTYSALRAEAFRHAKPGNTLRAANQHLLQVNRSGLFVTLLYGILDCTTGEFTYGRAGHPAPVLLDSSYNPVQLPVGLGQPIGLFDDPTIDEQQLLIAPQQTFLMFSDGLSETIDEFSTATTLPEICQSLMAEQTLKTQDFCAQLWKAVGGSETESLIKDDFTVVCLRNVTPG